MVVFKYLSRKKRIEMVWKILQWRSQLSQQYINNKASIRNKFDTIPFPIIKLPDFFSGTIVEKWGSYWKALFRDYRDVTIDIFKFARDKPIRASAIGGVAASLVYCSKRNPDDTAFMNQLRLHNATLVLVSDECRSPVSSQYVTFLERCHNEGILRRLNIGVASVLWLDNFDRAVCLYKATCKHTKYDLLTWHDRVIDIGFLDKWWKLEKAMEDYDINDTSF